MRKGESVRNITSKKRIEANLEVAKYGKFAGSKALNAFKEFQMGLVASESEEMRRINPDFPKAALVDGSGPLIEAMKRRDAGFFEELAELLRWLQGRTEVASPVWERFTTYVWAQQEKIRYGERKTEITRKEVAEYLANKFNDRVPDPKISKMATACGIKLKPGKSGPSEAWRRRRVTD